MSFDEQHVKRKHGVFKQSIRLQEVASQAFVQRVPIRYLKRLHAEAADEADPVVAALQRLDSIFAHCKSASIDVLSSVEALLAEFEETRSPHSCVLLAWRMTFDASRRRLNAPELVGIATLADFALSAHFSTDRASLSPGDHATLCPYARNWAYIDCMCSSAPGVGRLLVLHAYSFALACKKDGLISLSYSSTRKATPESLRLFQQLGFQPLIPQAHFAIQHMYGTWFVKRDVDLSGLAMDGVRVCTRTGFTARTADTLMWRCP